MLAAALGITIILISGAANAQASSASQYCHHQQSYAADQVRRGLQPRQTGAGANVQVFSGALGGIRAAAVTTTGDALRPYAVCGDTFMDFASAAARSCDDQMNGCAEVANAGGANFSVGDCEAQACEYLSSILLPFLPPPPLLAALSFCFMPWEDFGWSSRKEDVQDGIKPS